MDPVSEISTEITMAEQNNLQGIDDVTKLVQNANEMIAKSGTANYKEFLNKKRKAFLKDEIENFSFIGDKKQNAQANKYGKVIKNYEKRIKEFEKVKGMVKKHISNRDKVRSLMKINDPAGADDSFAFYQNYIVGINIQLNMAKYNKINLKDTFYTYYKRKEVLETNNVSNDYLYINYMFSKLAKTAKKWGYLQSDGSITEVKNKETAIELRAINNCVDIKAIEFYKEINKGDKMQTSITNAVDYIENEYYPCVDKGVSVVLTGIIYSTYICDMYSPKLIFELKFRYNGTIYTTALITDMGLTIEKVGVDTSRKEFLNKVEGVIKKHFKYVQETDSFVLNQDSLNILKQIYKPKKKERIYSNFPYTIGTNTKIREFEYKDNTTGLVEKYVINMKITPNKVIQSDMWFDKNIKFDICAKIKVPTNAIINGNLDFVNYQKTYGLWGIDNIHYFPLIYLLLIKGKTNEEIINKFKEAYSDVLQKIWLYKPEIDVLHIIYKKLTSFLKTLISWSHKVNEKKSFKLLAKATETLEYINLIALGNISSECITSVKDAIDAANDIFNAEIDERTKGQNKEIFTVAKAGEKNNTRDENFTVNFLEINFVELVKIIEGMVWGTEYVDGMVTAIMKLKNIANQTCPFYFEGSFDINREHINKLFEYSKGVLSLADDKTLGSMAQAVNKYIEDSIALLEQTVNSINKQIIDRPTSIGIDGNGKIFTSDEGLKKVLVETTKKIEDLKADKKILEQDYNTNQNTPLADTLKKLSYTFKNMFTAEVYK